MLIVQGERFDAYICFEYTFKKKEIVGMDIQSNTNNKTATSDEQQFKTKELIKTFPIRRTIESSSL